MKKYHKNMITCILLEIIIRYNPFMMIEMNASITRYQEGVGKERTKERSIMGEK